METITIFEVSGKEGPQVTKEVTKDQLSQLVDLDLAWFDNKDWCYIDCEETDEYFAEQNII